MRPGKIFMALLPLLLLLTVGASVAPVAGTDGGAVTCLITTDRLSQPSVQLSVYSLDHTCLRVAGISKGWLYYRHNNIA